MRYAKVREMDISNGTGIRVSLFVQGCPHHCKGCFNPETWGFHGGEEWTESIQNKFIELGLRDYISGYTILGGEPLAQDHSMLELVKSIKQRTDKSIWLYTGYTYEQLNDFQKEVVFYVDVLVDGRFVEEEKDYKLQFRGSRNQRIIDVQKSIQNNMVVLYMD